MENKKRRVKRTEKERDTKKGKRSVHKQKKGGKKNTRCKMSVS